MFSIKIDQYCDNLSKVIGATLFNRDYPIFLVIQAKLLVKPPNPPPSFLKRCNGSFECDVSVKYEG